jgi:hypothetical protein
MMACRRQHRSHRKGGTVKSRWWCWGDVSAASTLLRSQHQIDAITCAFVCGLRVQMDLQQKGDSSWIRWSRRAWLL